MDRSPIFYPRREVKRGSVYPTEEIGVYKIWKLADKMIIKLDVQLFHPDEIRVRILDNFVIIEGNHGASPNEGHEHLYHQVHRSFERKFLLPPHADGDNLTSDIAVDGYLTVTVPIVPPPSLEEEQQGKFYKVTHALGSILHLPSWHESFQLKNDTTGVALSKEKLTVSLEIPNFEPHDIQVKTKGDVLIIEGYVDDDDDKDKNAAQGGHRGRGDGRSGSVCCFKANFTRKYPLPLNADKERIHCEFSQNMGTGIPILKVIVPRIHLEKASDKEAEHKINVV